MEPPHLLAVLFSVAVAVPWLGKVEPEGSALQAEANISTLAAATYIVKNEGAGTLLQGVGPTFTGYFLQGSIKYGLYQVFTSGITGYGLQVVVLQVLAAAAAETVGSTVLCPLEATRIRMVLNRGYADSFGAGFLKLVNQEGADGMFGTLPAILAKQIPYTVTQLVIYDQVQSSLTAVGSDRWLATLVGALAATVPASLASQPGDTLLTWLNQHPPPSLCPPAGSTPPPTKRSRLLTCGEEMAAVAEELGPAGLFAGYRERLWHVGTIVFSQLLINDAVKHSLGL